MDIRELRLHCGLTQPEAAQIVGIPFRTYCRYEAQESYKGSFKYEQIAKILNEQAKDRVLSINEIKDAVSDLCSRFYVNVCYLFGSYAKGKATKDSDIDLMIASELDGIEYYELLGLLEEKLGKKIDLIRLETAIQNIKLMGEILKDGVKIYSR